MTEDPVWLQLSADQVEALERILTDGVSHMDPYRQDLLDRLAHFQAPEQTDARYREAANQVAFVRDGECEIDDFAVV